MAVAYCPPGLDGDRFMQSTSVVAGHSVSDIVCQTYLIFIRMFATIDRTLLRTRSATMIYMSQIMETLAVTLT